MSLKFNIVASYASQAYVTLIGVVLIPLYLQHMGSEAYGLVGFFAMLQALFNLLDLGLTPTIARESARYQGGAMSALAYRRLFRTLSVIFVFIALSGGAALFVSAAIVAERWLKIRTLLPAEVLGAVRIMALCVSLRWMGGLYRGVISGAERLVWLSGFNALIATLRFVGVFVSMSIWGYTPAVFFWHQLVVAALEAGTLLCTCHRLLPPAQDLNQRIGWSFRPVQSLLRFSLTIAFTSSVWVLVTQADKLVLSGMLPLAEYGYFTLAVLVAGSLTIIAGPVNAAVLPRLARMHAEGDHEGVRRVYGQAAQLMTVIVGSMAVTLVVCSESILFAWTGNLEVTEAATPILRLYAIGNGLLALGAFPFYLQYARGNLRYHLVGNVMMVVVLVPTIIWAAMKAGGVGAGWVWVVTNAIYLLFWVGYVHSKLEPGLHRQWLVNDILVIIVPTLLIGLALGFIHSGLGSRVFELLRTGSVAAACLLVAIAASSVVRPFVLPGKRQLGLR